MKKRTLSFADKLILQIDQGLRAISGATPPATRDYPAKDIQQTPMTEKEKKHVAGLMRINHTGEVCAQALYQGQALVARSKTLQQRLKQSADEELDHLNWCQQRLNELDSHVSYFNPLWHFGALSLGMIAGIAGDKWNLGFLAETEHQVVKHLEDHLQQLPEQDERDRRILEQMREDEAHHADIAIEYGGAKLPAPIKTAMHYSSKFMKSIAYYA